MVSPAEEDPLIWLLNAGGRQAICGAVMSLYEDGIKPEAKILRRRLHEHERTIIAQSRDLGELCELAGLKVEWKGTERKRDDNFVVLIPDDQEAPAQLVTPEECDLDKWKAANEAEWAAFKARLEKEDLSKKRLTCAYALAKEFHSWPQLHRRIPCRRHELGAGEFWLTNAGVVFAPLKLTDCRSCRDDAVGCPNPPVARPRLGVLHGLVTQLLNKRLLGHCNDGKRSIIVSFQASQEHERLKHYSTPREGVVQTWDELRNCLRKVLKLGTGVQLQRVKVLVKERCQRELHQEAFDYIKLEELLRDPKLADVVKITKEDTRVFVFMALPEKVSLMPMAVVQRTFISFTAEQMAEEADADAAGLGLRRSKSHHQLL